MKKLKLIIYLLLLSIIPFFVIKSIFNNVLDVAVVRVNYYSLKAAEHAKVDKILVQRGDKVIKGQLILTMTSDELSNELIVINNSINSMKNNYQIKLASLSSDLLIAQKNSIFEHDQLNKYRQYFKEGAVSLIMLDGANQNYIKSLFNAESIKNSIIQAKQDYDLNLSQLLQQKAILEAKISSLKKYANSSGKINSVFVQAGQDVNFGDELLSIDSGARIILETTTPLKNTVYLKVGFHFVPCNTINIANNEKKIGIIGVARDKITYLLKCNKIDERYLVDNQTFYTWK